MPESQSIMDNSAAPYPLHVGSTSGPLGEVGGSIDKPAFALLAGMIQVSSKVMVALAVAQCCWTNIVPSLRMEAWPSANFRFHASPRRLEGHTREQTRTLSAWDY